MIKITVELIYGGLGVPKKIGESIIWNDGTGSKAYGNYNFVINEEKIGHLDSGKIMKFDRLKLNVWDLIYRMLKGKIKEGKNG